MTYEAAIAALNAINARVGANKAGKTVAEYEAFIAERRAINEAAGALGFVRIFDGRFKLNLKNFPKE